jgi:hypothetical protein
MFILNNMGLALDHYSNVWRENKLQKCGIDSAGSVQGKVVQFCDGDDGHSDKIMGNYYQLKILYCGVISSDFRTSLIWTTPPVQSYKDEIFLSVVNFS